MNISLIINTIQELTNNTPIYSLDNCDNHTRQEILLNLRTIINDLNYDTNTGKLYFESFSITNKEEEAILLASLQALDEKMCIMNASYFAEIAESSASIDHSNELMNRAILPLFEQRYLLSLIPEFSPQEQQHIPNLLTWHSSLSDRDVVNDEQELNRMGIYKYHYPYINIERGNLHVFDAHAPRDTPIYKIHNMRGITPRGGDLLPVACYQGRETVSSLLRYLHRNSPPTDTGIIHLEQSEPLGALELSNEEMGVILFGESRARTNTNRPPNRFMRTTLLGTTPITHTSSYITTGRSRVSIQISPDGDSLYLGQHSNFFANRNRLLNLRFRNTLQSLQHLDPFDAHHPRYHVNFDFNHVTSRIGEMDICNFFDGLKSPESYIHFYNQFVNPITQHIDYNKLNLFFTNPQEYHARYMPTETFAPYENRACIWVNKPIKQHQSQSNRGINSFAKRMTTRTIERKERPTRTNRQAATSNTPRKNKRDRLKRSHSFS